MEDRYRNLIETTEDSEVIFHGKVFDTIVKTVSLPDGQKGKREIVVHHGGACVLPVDEDTVGKPSQQQKRENDDAYLLLLLCFPDLC